MDSHEALNASSKRKRSPAEVVPMPRQRQAPTATSFPVDYLRLPRGGKVALMDTDMDSFQEMNELFSKYEEILGTRQSFASRLGAKLTAPLLVKSMNKLLGDFSFIPEGAIAVGDMPTWTEVVEKMKTDPQAFTPEEANGTTIYKVCIRKTVCEIPEDSWRLIKSGAPERMIPTQPIPEDEQAELATIDILEQRLNAIIKKVDSIAYRARQVNYQLGKRKGAILERQSNPSQLATASSAIHHSNGNDASSTPTPNIHADLLRQFVPPTSAPPSMYGISPYQPPKTSRVNSVADFTNVAYGGSVDRASPIGNSRSENPTSQSGSAVRTATPSRKALEDPNRATLMTLMEKLARGQEIYPPCDRCRRLSIACTKHQTACSGCTKKHARCTWRDAPEAELAALSASPAPPQQQNPPVDVLPLVPGPSTALVADEARKFEEISRLNSAPGPDADPKEADMP